MKLKVVSSSKTVFVADDVKEINVPTTEGRLGILPGHINLVSTLDIGDLRIKMNNKNEVIFLNGGLLQVTNDEITILADEASLSAEVVKEEIENAIKNAEMNISTSKLPPSELIQLEKKLRYEKFKQQAVSN